jgi:alanine dehydrogenase
MLIGVPKEIKVHEYRVGLTPESVSELVAAGCRVLVERDAGAGIDATDGDYSAAGASIAATPDELYGEAELVVKVKEPLAPERARLRAGQALFTYLHLAPDPEQARDLVASGCIAIAYETVTAPDGGLPLLAPMSAVAGRMSVQVAAHYLERPHGGRGVLMSGAEGVRPARVVILGAGVVGSNAARIAVAMGAQVSVLARAKEELERVSSACGGRVAVALSTPESIAGQVHEADAVIGAALVPGARAPTLITKDMLPGMQRGAVLVDVSIDQGGCFETSRPTTLAEPVYEVSGIVHYCVANMPGAVPRTSTYALNHATLPFVKKLAGLGVVAALREDEYLRAGLNVCRGAVTQREVARAVGLPPVAPLTALAA